MSGSRLQTKEVTIAGSASETSTNVRWLGGDDAKCENDIKSTLHCYKKSCTELALITFFMQIQNLHCPLESP